MLRLLARYRALIALLTAALWAVGAVAGPAHAAEEEIHHATQHEDDGGLTAAQDQGAPQDERSAHPEHATHCHSGGCHFHAMARTSETPAFVPVTTPVSRPSDVSSSQISTGSLFRPPRV